jgi:hypothetical protein
VLVLAGFLVERVWHGAFRGDWLRI